MFPLRAAAGQGEGKELRSCAASPSSEAQLCTPILGPASLGQETLCAPQEANYSCSGWCDPKTFCVPWQGLSPWVSLLSICLHPPASQPLLCPPGQFRKEEGEGAQEVQRGISSFPSSSPSLALLGCCCSFRIWDSELTLSPDTAELKFAVPGGRP